MEEKKSIARAIERLTGGSQRRRGRCWAYGFAALLSVATFVLFWCTSAFRDAILWNLELRNGSRAFLLWQRPPVGLQIHVYVFNYTNAREFESGTARKLRVQEVGPFVYRESLSRANVRLHENGTVTYQEKRSFQRISGLSERQNVIVPNVLLMSALAYSRDLNYLLQIGFTVMMTGLKLRAKPFLELPVGEYFWGYEDELFEMAKRFPPLKQSLPYDKFGILAFVRSCTYSSLATTLTLPRLLAQQPNPPFVRRVSEKRLERGSHHDAHGNRRPGSDPADQRPRQLPDLG